jgi:hypothetical protein
MADDARRRQILASNRRWRLVFAVLAVVVPAVLFALFRRQEARLWALADHGRPTTATISHITRQDAALYSHYTYTVDGTSHEWSVSRAQAPYEPGESFPITFLPEDPSLSRPVVPYSRERLQVELNRPVTRGFPIGAFIFFAGAALLCHRAVRHREEGEGEGSGPRLSPDAAGRLVATLILGATLAAGFDPKVRAVQAALLGPAPLGVPPVVIASLVQAVLLVPLFWVMPHLMRIVMSAQTRGNAFSKIGVLIAVANAPAELRRSRWVVLGGFLYFAALLVGWIALASAKGL